MANDFFNDVLPMDSAGIDFLKTGNVPTSGSNDWGFDMGGYSAPDTSFNFLNQPKFNQGSGYGDMLGAGTGLLSSLFGMGAARQNRQQMQQLADQQNAIMGRLNQSYADPNSYLNSPEGRALRSQTAQAIARKAAASGMRSQTGAQMNALNEAMMGNLGKYRQGLQQAYNPQLALAAQQAAQRKSPIGEIMTGLGGLFGSKGGEQLLGKALPILGGALGGLGGLASNAFGGLGSLFNGSTPDLSFVNPGVGFSDLPSIDEWIG